VVVGAGIIVPIAEQSQARAQSEATTIAVRQVIPDDAVARAAPEARAPTGAKGAERSQRAGPDARDA
jgi:hypothetical protein